MYSRLGLFWLLLGGFTFFSLRCIPADKAPNYSFMKQATSAPLLSAFDYIVVGGGTAGCALAATLSERADVLLLERGGSPYGNSDIENMANFANNLANLLPNSPAQQFISEDGVINARARVLGGGSAINAGFYTRASPSYVAEAGWDGALANRSYEWVERKVAFEPPMLQFQSAVRDGLLEAGVRPYNGFTYDHMYGTKVGGTIFDNEGKRHTAADLLEYANPRRITVYLHAVVHKVVFSVRRFQRPRAIGVIFMDTNRVMHKAYLRPGGSNEVILSAGAIGSTQLLMLSGVGPAEELRLYGIDVVLNQPMVGQGMADNPMNALFVPSPSPVETSLIQVVGITEFDSYIEAASGSAFARAFTQNLPKANRVYPPHQPQGKNATSESVYEQKTAADIAKAYDFIYSLLNGTLRAGLILEKTNGPRSKGFLRLTSRDPNENPSVTFNYFQEPEDLYKCVKGMETIVKVLDSTSFSGFRYPFDTRGLFTTMVSLPLNLRPRHFDSSFDLEQFCRDTVLTIWHYHGGCQVGKVVDKDYRVIGVDALRVVDGSTYHGSPGTNPQATCMMLGRYMGVRILGQRGGA